LQAVWNEHASVQNRVTEDQNLKFPSMRLG
jgi:hypothetical protein